MESWSVAFDTRTVMSKSFSIDTDTAAVLHAVFAPSTEADNALAAAALAVDC